jgi:hypothetical protein
MSLRHGLERFGLWLGIIAAGVGLVLVPIPHESMGSTDAIRAFGWLVVLVGVIGVIVDPISWVRRPREKVFVADSPKALSDLYRDRFGFQGDALAKHKLGKWMRYTGAIRDLDEAAGRRWRVWPHMVSTDDPYVVLTFSARWRDRLQSMKPGDRFTAVGRIESIDKTTIRLNDCELVASEPASPPAQTQPEPFVPTTKPPDPAPAALAPAALAPAAAEPVAPEPALRVLLPSGPTPGRVYLGLSPKELVEPFESHVTIQAQQLVAAYIGKWLRIAGRVRDVSRSEDERGWQISPQRDRDLGGGSGVYLYFGPEWKDHVAVLRRGDPFTVDGRIESVESFGVILETCELVGVAPPAPPAPSAPTAVTSSEAERLDRSLQMFAARIAYVEAWHKGSTFRQLKARREELERAHPDDMPEVLLDGTPEWREYLETERRVLAEARARPQPSTPVERVREIERAAAAVNALFNRRRRTRV